MQLNSRIKEKFLKDWLVQILYMIAVPFYMVEISLLIMISNKTEMTDLWYLSPLFLSTIWIPAFLSVTLNQLCRYLFQSGRERKWYRNYPTVFIFLYAVYFFILSRFSFANYCLAAALAGLVLIVFLFLLKKGQKQMYYLPPEKEFWFYAFVFLPPIVVLFFTDVYFLILKESPYFILMAPVSYLPEILGFLITVFLYKHLVKKPKKLTLFNAVCIMQVFNIATALYFGAYYGDKIIWITLSISLGTLLWSERVSRFRELSHPQDGAMPTHKAEY